MQQSDPADHYSRMIFSGNLQVIVIKGEITGFGGLCLDNANAVEVFIQAPEGVTGAHVELLSILEERACQYGLSTLFADPDTGHCPLFMQCGYEDRKTEGSAGHRQRDQDGNTLQKSLRGMFDPYQKRIDRLLHELNIPASYGPEHLLTMQSEAHTLVSIGPDIYGRDQKMHPNAASAWSAMRESARAEGVQLCPVSAFRSVDYQTGLVRRKLAAGEPIREILRVSSAPGFSEHHSGRAIDIAEDDHNPLEESFAESRAFSWLCDKADSHGFSMSYPRGNPHGICYEPWHWAWRGLRY